MANDQLAIDLFINDAAASRALEQFHKKLHETDSTANVLAKRTGQIAPNIAKARAETEAFTRAQSALATLQGRVASGGGPLTKEQRYGRINLARQGADVFTTAAMGMDPLMIAIQQGPQAIEAMAMSGGKFATVMKAAAASAGPIAAVAAGVLAVGYTVNMVYQDLTAASRQRLAVETKIQEVLKKQAEEAQKAKANLQAQSLAAKDQDEWSRWLNSASVEEQRARLALYQNFIDGDLTDRSALEYGPKKLELEARLRKSDFNNSSEGRNEAMNARFANDWENWKKQQEASAKAAEEAEKKFQESVKEGKKIVREYGKELADMQRGLFAQRTADNPFVKVFTDAKEAIDKVRESTRGVSADLKETFLTLQRNENAFQLFKTRMDSAFEAQDLRFRANEFRSAGSLPMKPEDQAELWKRTRSTMGTVWQVPGLTSWNRDTAMIGAYRLNQERMAREQAGDGGMARDRLAAQLDLARGFGRSAQNERERAAVDARITSLASGVDPRTLGAGDKEDIAAAFERQAIRVEKREQDAAEDMKAQTAYQKAIAEALVPWMKKAEKEGKAGVTVLVKNESDDQIDVKPPTQSDTDRAFANVFYSGSNQGNR